MVICHLPYGPTATFTIYNTVMRHDIPNVGTMSEAFPHLIFHNFKTKLGERVREKERERGKERRNIPVILVSGRPVVVVRTVRKCPK